MSNNVSPTQEAARPIDDVPIEYHSSLSYTNVRDFAYPPSDPLHYGPPPEPTPNATPSTTGRNSGLFSGPIGWWSRPDTTQYRRSSDPSGPRGYPYDDGTWHDPRAAHNHPPPLKFADGPPWFEDEDLASPVVITNRHRKHKSSMAGLSARGSRDEGTREGRTGSRDDKHRLGSVSEMSNRIYPAGDVDDMNPEDLGEPGGTYSSTTGEYYSEGEEEEEYEEASDDEYEMDDSRFSKDYHFSIASPDEEMHGKAVALFDFTRENDNELGLLEGQVIWVSYRHGQGWLVAEDPKTGESGLVPEEYVRLFREIPEHNSIDGAVFSPVSNTPSHASTTNPTTTMTQNGRSGSPTHNPVIQSHFTTSSRDLQKYPHTSNLHSENSSPPPISRDGSKQNSTEKNVKNDSSAMDIDEEPELMENYSLQQGKDVESGSGGGLVNGADVSMGHSNPLTTGAAHTSAEVA